MVDVLPAGNSADASWEFQTASASATVPTYSKNNHDANKYTFLCDAKWRG